VASLAANTSPKPTPTLPPKAKPQLSGNFFGNLLNFWVVLLYYGKKTL
jgi:hypothetical protein